MVSDASGWADESKSELLFEGLTDKAVFYSAKGVGNIAVQDYDCVKFFTDSMGNQFEYYDDLNNSECDYVYDAYTIITPTS